MKTKNYSLNCSSEHIDCRFDNPDEYSLPKIRNLVARNAKKTESCKNFNDKKFPQNFSLDLQKASFDKATSNFRLLGRKPEIICSMSEKHK